MRLLLTGATGFLGSATAQGMLADGHAVGVVVRSGSERETIDPRAKVLKHDGSTEGLYQAVSSFRPDAAVHLASRFVAAHAPGDIESLVTSNLLFGCQLADALIRCDCTRLVNFGTAWQHYHGDAYEPVSLYAATKQAFEDLLAFYASAHGLSVVTLKLSDTYGPRDPRPKLIALLTRLARTGERLEMSAGVQVINLIHVQDVVAAVRVALDRVMAAPPGRMEAFAVRGAELMPLREFVAVFEAAAGVRLDIGWGVRPYRAREVMQPWLGPLLPHWSPAIPLAEGLSAMLETDVRV